MSAADDALRRDLEALAERWDAQALFLGRLALPDIPDAHVFEFKATSGEANELRAVLAAHPVPTPDADEVEHLAKVLWRASWRGHEDPTWTFEGLVEEAKEHFRIDARAVIADGYTRGGTVAATGKLRELKALWARLHTCGCCYLIDAEAFDALLSEEDS